MDESNLSSLTMITLPLEDALRANPNLRKEVANHLIKVKIPTEDTRRSLQKAREVNLNSVMIHKVGKHSKNKEGNATTLLISME